MTGKYPNTNKGRIGFLDVICFSCQEFVEPGHLCFTEPCKVDVDRGGENEMSDDEFQAEQMDREKVEKELNSSFLTTKQQKMLVITFTLLTCV